MNVQEAGVFWSCGLVGCWSRQPGTVELYQLEIEDEMRYSRLSTKKDKVQGARVVIMNSNERSMFQRATADITVQGEDWILLGIIWQV